MNESVLDDGLLQRASGSYQRNLVFSRCPNACSAGAGTPANFVSRGRLGSWKVRNSRYHLFPWSYPILFAPSGSCPTSPSRLSPPPGLEDTKRIAHVCVYEQFSVSRASLILVLQLLCSTESFVPTVLSMRYRWRSGAAPRIAYVGAGISGWYERSSDLMVRISPNRLSPDLV
jgi:hypothetical protein